MDGFSDFCFGIHRKDLVAGPEHWAPSETGAYVYLLSSGPASQSADLVIHFYLISFIYALFLKVVDLFPGRAGCGSQ